MYPWFKFFNEYNNEKLDAPHPIKGLLIILEIAVFQIFILGKENISLKLFEFGKKLEIISFSLKKFVELIGISRINIEEINPKNIKYMKKIVLILNPIINVKAIERLVIAFLECVKTIAKLKAREVKQKNIFLKDNLVFFKKKKKENGKIEVSQVPA